MIRRILSLALIAVAACGGKIDPDALGQTGGAEAAGAGSSASGPSTNVSYGGSGRPSASNDVGQATPTGCASVTPWSTDFEKGFDPTLSVANPEGFSIDTVDPIEGSASLRVDPGQASYFIHDVGSACKVTVDFTIRASNDLLQKGGSLLKIDAGQRAFTLSVAPGNGGLTFMETLTLSPTSGGGGGGPVGPLPTDVTKIGIVYDLTASTIAITIGTGAPNTIPMMSGGGGVIKAVMFGAVPPGLVAPGGTYWLDDISVE